MNNLRRIGINMISGGAGYILPMAINIFSAPYVLSKLGEQAFGLQVLANVIIGYLIVADMGLDIPITQKIAEYQATGNSEKRNQFLIATIKIYFIIGCLGSLILLIATPRLVTLLAIPDEIIVEGKIIFYLSGVGFLGSILNMWGKAVFNGLHQYDIANGVAILNNLFGITFGIILILNGYGIVGFFGARVFGFLLANMAYIFMSRKYLKRFVFRPIVDDEIWTLLKKQIGYGFTLRLSGMIFSRMDQTLISAWIGITAVTAYSFPILIATAISGMIASLTHVAFPMVSAMHATSSKESIELFFFKITKFIVAISTISFFPFIILGDKFLALWISPEIAAKSQVVMFFLMISFYVNSCLTIGVNAFVVGIGQLRYFTFYSITRGLGLFAGFLILINIYGLEGAGLSYVIIIIIDILFVLFTFRKKFNFNISNVFLKAYFKPILLGVMLGIVLFLLRSYIQTWVGLISSVCFYGFFYIILSYVIGILDLEEKKLIKSFLLKYWAVQK